MHCSFSLELSSPKHLGRMWSISMSGNFFRTSRICTNHGWILCFRVLSPDSPCRSLHHRYPLHHILILFWIHLKIPYSTSFSAYFIWFAICYVFNTRHSLSVPYIFMSFFHNMLFKSVSLDWEICNQKISSIIKSCKHEYPVSFSKTYYTRLTIKESQV